MEFCFLISFVTYIYMANGFLSPEGCEENWLYFNDFCYNFVVGEVHFDTALEICSVVKEATLATLWEQEEYQFVAENLKKINAEATAWVGIVPSQSRQSWQWIDGTPLERPEHDLPEPMSDVCASICTGGKLDFVDCDLARPAFVCKKPVDMLYLSSQFNETTNLVDRDLETVVFERQWPPVLNVTLLETFQGNHLATVEVAHETDCAYRCYTLDDCRGFLLRCQPLRKCNSYACSLLSEIKKDEL